MSKVVIDRAVVEQALETLEMMGVPSPLVFLPDEIKSWQTVQATLSAALEQPQVEQEPVAVIGDVWTLNWVGSGPIDQIVKKHGLKIGDKLYTHPQPPRQPLTEMEIVELRQLTPGTLDVQFVTFARAIERAHRIGDEK